MTSQSASGPNSGLSTERARALLAVHGPNRLVPKRRRVPVVAWLLRALADPMAALLLIASSTYLVLRDYVDAAVTFGALVPISAVTLVLERRAEQALERLKRLTAPAAIVWRDGRRQTVKTEALVPDDIIILHEGDIIPADAILLEGAALVVDESALTGEAYPVLKDVTAEGGDHLLFAGTTLRAGRGVARVTATGAATRYGRIGTLVARITPPLTPLQRLIRRLIRQLARGAAILCAGVFAIEVIQGHGWAAGGYCWRQPGDRSHPGRVPYRVHALSGTRRLEAGQRAGVDPALDRCRGPGGDHSDLRGQDRHAHALFLDGCHFAPDRWSLDIGPDLTFFRVIINGVEQAEYGLARRQVVVSWWRDGARSATDLPRHLQRAARRSSRIALLTKPPRAAGF